MKLFDVFLTLMNEQQLWRHFAITISSSIHSRFFVVLFNGEIPKRDLIIRA